MAEHRLILATGSGCDHAGADYTLAACRAVQDAWQHVALGLFPSLGIEHAALSVQVTLGVQTPERVDCAAVAVVTAVLLPGLAEVMAVPGGLDIHDPEQGTTQVVATAAVEVYMPLQADAWRLAGPAEKVGADETAPQAAD